MKILITGHLGFIGCNLWEALKKKHDLIGYDIKQGDDICNKRELEFIFETENIDCVIHLAALTGARRGEFYPEEYFKVNVIGTKNVIDLTEKYKVKQLIHFSSSSVIHADTIYGMSKLCGENIAYRSILPSVAIIRPFTVIGEYGRTDQVIYKWINQIKSGKPIELHGLKTSRNFTWVGDIVRFINQIIDLNLTIFSPFLYELCNPVSLTLGQLLDIYKKHFKEVVFTDTGLDDNEAFESKGSWAPKFKATDAVKIIHKILKKEL